MSDEEPFRTLPTISLPRSTDERLTAYATLRAKLLFGCYRRGEVADPDVYIRAAAVVLLDYSTAIMQAVTHASTGLPARSQFLPTIKEIRDACEAMAEVERRSADRDARIAAQLAARKEADAPREMRPSYDELKAKYGEDWGIKNPDAKPKPKVPTEAEFRERTARVWSEVVKYYQDRPGRINELANAHPKLRGEV